MFVLLISYVASEREEIRMNVRIKRILGLVCAIAVLVPAMLMARPVAITWDWFQNDPDVTYFRYQLNGEDADGWTVIEADVLTYTSDALDGTVAQALYLQQSYDGVLWSPSAVSVVDALFAPGEIVAEEEPVAETPASSIALVGEVPAEATDTAPVVEESVPVEPEAEEPVVVAEAPEEEETVVEVVPEVEEPAPVVEVSPASTSVAVAATAPVVVAVPVNATVQSLDLRVGVSYAMIDENGIYDRLVPGIDLTWRLDNGLKLGNRFGIGLQAGIFYDAYLKSAAATPVTNANRFKLGTAWFETNAGTTLYHTYGISLAPRFSFAFNEKTSLALAAGGRVIFSNDALSPNELLPAPLPLIGGKPFFGLNYGITGSLELRHNFSKGFGVGLGLDYDWLLGENERHSFGATLFMGIGL